MSRPVPKDADDRSFAKPFVYRGMTIQPPERAYRARVRELYEAMIQTASGKHARR